MTAPARVTTPTAPNLHGPLFEALAEVMASATTYANTTVQFAELHDLRGAAYGLRSAAACIRAAAETLDDLRREVERQKREAGR